MSVVSCRTTRSIIARGSEPCGWGRCASDVGLPDSAPLVAAELSSGPDHDPQAVRNNVIVMSARGMATDDVAVEAPHVIRKRFTLRAPVPAVHCEACNEGEQGR